MAHVFQAFFDILIVGSCYMDDPNRPPLSPELTAILDEAAELWTKADDLSRRFEDYCEKHGVQTC